MINSRSATDRDCQPIGEHVSRIMAALMRRTADVGPTSLNRAQ